MLKSIITAALVAGPVVLAAPASAETCVPAAAYTTTTPAVTVDHAAITEQVKVIDVEGVAAVEEVSHLVKVIDIEAVPGTPGVPAIEEVFHMEKVIDVVGVPGVPAVTHEVKVIDVAAVAEVSHVEHKIEKHVKGYIQTKIYDHWDNTGTFGYIDWPGAGPIWDSESSFTVGSEGPHSDTFAETGNSNGSTRKVSTHFKYVSVDTRTVIDVAAVAEVSHIEVVIDVPAIPAIEEVSHLVKIVDVVAVPAVPAIPGIEEVSHLVKVVDVEAVPAVVEVSHNETNVIQKAYTETVAKAKTVKHAAVVCPTDVPALPATGSNGEEWGFAIAGLALIGLGTAAVVMYRRKD